MNIDSSINPMPARRAERSSVAVEILESRLIYDRGLRFMLFVMAGHSRPKDGVASARLCPAIHVLRAALL
jgi:hypothetical protein